VFNINNSQMFIQHSQWQCRRWCHPAYIHKVHQ